MSTRPVAALLLATFLSSPFTAVAAETAAAERMSLPAAMGALAEARYQMATCVGVVKTRGDQDTRQRIEVKYGETRAVVNGMLTRVTTAAKLCTPDTFKAFDTATIAPKLRAVAKARADICATAQTLLPKAEGDKGPWLLIAQIVGTAVVEKAAEVAIQSIVDWIWPKTAEPAPDTDRCRNVEAMVEAKMWPPFADVQPVGK